MDSTIKSDEIYEVKELIYEEQSNLNIASKIDEINGLLLDIYM